MGHLRPRHAAFEDVDTGSLAETAGGKSLAVIDLDFCGECLVDSTVHFRN